MNTLEKTVMPGTSEVDEPCGGGCAPSLSEEGLSGSELRISDVANESRESYGFDESSGGDAFQSGIFL